MNREDKNVRRLKRNQARIAANRARKKRQRKPRTQRCDSCGGQMQWCELCQMFSKTCCEEYGTCMCS